MDFEIELIRQGKKGHLYSVVLPGESESELVRFLKDPEVRSAPDFDLLLARLDDLMNRFGFQERFFRPESKYLNSVMALSAGGKKHRLRLYCCRWGERTLIVGNGGVKGEEIRTYQESPFLNSCVEAMEGVDTALEQRITKQKLITVSDDGALIGDLSFTSDS